MHVACRRLTQSHSEKRAARDRVATDRVSVVAAVVSAEHRLEAAHAVGLGRDRGPSAKIFKRDRHASPAWAIRHAVDALGLIEQPLAMASAKPRKTRENSTLEVFARAAEQYVEETFERFPSYGSSTGRHEFDPELERPSEALYRAHEKLVRETLTQVEDLPELDFRGNDWLDRRALLAELRTELWSIERGEFRKNPERWASGALGSVHNLVVKHADDLKPAADAILSRLAKLPAYLAGGAELITAPIPVWTHMAEQSCAGAPSLLDAIAEPLKLSKRASPVRVDALLTRAKAAFAAYSAQIQRAKPGPK